MRASAARDWRLRYPAPLRPFLTIGNRAGWGLAALGRTLQFARAARLAWPATGRLYGDCLLTGGDPIEVHVWRGLHGDRHPLPARSAALVFRRLGDPAGHALLADKLALGERLSELGLAVPAMRAVLDRGSAAPSEIAAGAGTGAGLFLKPRHGSGGRGAFALTRDDGALRMDGAAVEPPAVVGRINRLLAHDDLLVQDRLIATDAIADLAGDGRPPVLRLATARAPGRAPFLDSALLMIARAGRNPRHFLEGTIYAPIDPAGARTAAGLSLAEPRRRIERLEQGARLAGRIVPDFDEAVAMALRAMTGLPPLSLIHWDIILTPRGPVLLEGNAAGNWIVASLPGIFGLESGALVPTLAQWACARD
ncbi:MULTISPECIES: sugar-transfer associated ATP-grasp domain-containing protein [unclassified Sphingomonas]|uniref:sugar-transfer associated ATP-grasp domain-containing protein n=1 Tax=unclassified Sphingomonas TaxID=196159 RepID=UPI0007007A47|nr:MULTISPECIES: sugar-transfer associated ATP-grasp domain-containing protein [unclassified Sphingomonas]KQX22677.1 hypothetical protein ASD17_05145 [Sphingomonas sp. Root1294]KQY67843.1 hypothetical protein ASD39_07980 [Sphingomonas sp. Root50]KRB88767.1 hypothetical protein ASE22_20330 [Sphingomonas sp. Root720]